MKRTALFILAAASVSALLLIAAGLKSPGIEQPHPYAAASWLAVVLAFGAFVVMLVEYLLHSRQTHLYIGAAFLATGIMGIWDTLTFPYDSIFHSEASRPAPWAYLSLWQSQWITLALVLLLGMWTSRPVSRQRVGSGAIIFLTAAVLWALIIIFLTAAIPAVSEAFAAGRVGVVASVACAVAFAITCFAYSRVAIHRSNAVLAWMGYGLIFAVLGQIAISLQAQPNESLFGFAGLMKVLAFLFPLAGMLAEHTRLRMRLRDQTSEIDYLVQAQRAVNSIESPEELYQRIADLVSVSCSAGAVCLMPFDKEHGFLRTAAQVGFDEEMGRRLIFRPGEGPAGDSFSAKETVFVRNISEDPILSQKLDGDAEIGSAVFIPLLVRDECLGVLAVFYGGRPVRKLSKEQLRLLDALASQAALAVDGVQLRGRAHESVRTSGDHARELEVVWEIGQAVASKLDLHVLVDTLADKLKIAVGATTCSVLVFETDIDRLKILGNRKLTRYRSVSDHEDQCDVMAVMAAQRGEPVAVNGVQNSHSCKYPELATESKGIHHMLSVPMMLRGFAGAISVFRLGGEPFGDKEKRLLMRLSPMVAAGIRNAELYERERRIAENLQKSFLPELDEREFTGLLIAHRYQAAFDDSLVGGDFYDVIDLGDGKYGIAIGDVAGKGLDAAVYTAMTRYMIQAYSADDPDPVYVASKLNSALFRYTPAGKFVTLVYGVLDAKRGKFTYANAGHEIPFIYRSVEHKLGTLSTTGPAAGAVAEAEYTSEEVPFEAEDVLVFYTDGATEARRDGKFLETEGLRDIVADHLHKTLDDLPGAILASINSYAEGHLRDDVAILVVKALAPGALF